jgi:hypothetical protein
MPKRKLTEEVWQEVKRSYDAWTPGDPAAPSIDDLLQPFGVSKQAFYAELRRRGDTTKAATDRPAQSTTADVDPEREIVLRTMLEALVDARVQIVALEQRIKSLETELDAARKRARSRS